MASVFYDKVLEQIRPYFSDESEDFLNRQVESHLSKTAGTVSSEDKEELAKWIQVSAGLLLGAVKGEEIAKKLREIN